MDERVSFSVFERRLMMSLMQKTLLLLYNTSIKKEGRVGRRVGADLNQLLPCASMSSGMTSLVELFAVADGLSERYIAFFTGENPTN